MKPKQAIKIQREVELEEDLIGINDFPTLAELEADVKAMYRNCGYADEANFDSYDDFNLNGVGFTS